MPFRLLCVAARFDELDARYGQLLKSCADSGNEVSLTCIEAGVNTRLAVHRLGLSDLILLDAGTGPGDEAVLQGALFGVIEAIRPHVVVATSNQPPGWSALESAVSKARKQAGRTGALPAKLYYGLSPDTPVVAVSAAVRVPGSNSPAFFVRAFPRPWVTGVLENDLFCGLAGEREEARQLPAAS